MRCGISSWRDYLGCEVDFTLFKPTLRDISEMRNLVAPEVQNGAILDRSADEMANAIRSYSVVRDNNGAIVAFSALHIHSITLGEVRSLMVAESYRRKGLATMLIGALLDEARALGLTEILTLTYRAEVFKPLGFYEIKKDRIPNHKIWADCIKCKHFPICDEIALLKIL